MLVMLNEAVPLLVRVTACAPLLVPTSWLAKVRLVGERLTAGALKAVPVPVKLPTLGLSLWLSLIVMLPVRLPAPVGVKVTLMLHFFFNDTAPTEIYPLSLPDALPILVMLNEAVPLLVRVTACAPLLVPTGWLAKVRLVGERLTAGAREAWPVPATLTV